MYAYTSRGFRADVRAVPAAVVVEPCYPSWGPFGVLFGILLGIRLGIRLGTLRDPCVVRVHM